MEVSVNRIALINKAVQRFDFPGYDCSKNNISLEYIRTFTQETCICSFISTLRISAIGDALKNLSRETLTLKIPYYYKYLDKEAGVSS